jgi:thiamine biosynthesis lipoprotein
MAPDVAGIELVSGAPRRAVADLLDLDRAAGRKRKRGAVGLDLSGIAKGFGVDELARVLEAAGIFDYLVSIDGEVSARGHKPNGKPWAIAVERPLRGSREAGGVIELTDRAVATSGDYRHWVELDGRLLSHTMDPRTGKPLANRLASVTVLAQDCMRADAWATVLLVLGEIEGPRFAATRNMDALFIMRGPHGLEEIPIGSFAQD